MSPMKTPSQTVGPFFAFGLPYEGAALQEIERDNELKSDIAHPNARGYARLAAAVAALLKKSGAI